MKGISRQGRLCNSKAALPLYYRSKPFCLGSKFIHSS